MPHRPVAEIESEIAHLKSEGKHPRSKELRALGAELKAAKGDEGTATTPEPTAPVIAETRAGSATAGGALEGFADAMSAQPDPFRSDEWRFIEKCCAEVEYDTGRSEPFKHLFNQLIAKVSLWRAARRLVEKIGLGNEWPQFAKLGLNPSTGLPEAPKPQPPKAAPAPAPAAEAAPVSPQAAVSAALAKAGYTQGVDELASFANALRNDIARAVAPA